MTNKKSYDIIKSEKRKKGKKKMTKREIKEKIAGLEEDLFFLNMKDRWNNRDYDLYTKLTNEIRKLKNGLDLIS